MLARDLESNNELDQGKKVKPTENRFKTGSIRRRAVTDFNDE